jgi:hypothetical protein
MRCRSTILRTARQLGAAVARDRFAASVDPRHCVPDWWLGFAELAASRAAGELFMHLSSDEDFAHGAAARAAASDMATRVAAELLDASRVAEWWPAAHAAHTAPATPAHTEGDALDMAEAVIAAIHAAAHRRTGIRVEVERGVVAAAARRLLAEGANPAHVRADFVGGALRFTAPEPA